MADAPNNLPAVLNFRPAWKRALAPPEQISPSEWAGQYRVLSDIGPNGTRWSNELSPALRVVMDICVDLTVREVYLMKGVQIGGSEAFRNVLGYFAHIDPCAVMLVLPTEKGGRSQVRKEYHPLFKATPPLNALRTKRASDFTKSEIRLRNGFEMHLGWSGSPSSLASMPKQRVFCDEVDKFEDMAGREAPPMELARFRVTQYFDRSLIVALSTPTLDTAPISQLFDAADIQLLYHVPCPHCGTPQYLHQDNLKWIKVDSPDPNVRGKVVQSDSKAAWFECVNHACRGKILEQHKPAIVRAGFWAPLDQSWKLYPDGRREGVRPIGTRIGFKYPSFYALNFQWSQIAAEWIRAAGNADLLMAVYNNRFAEPFRQQTAATYVDTFSKLCVADEERKFSPSAAGKVPVWASKLLLTVDTQKDYFFWVLRAWGYGRTSQRIAHGQAESFQDLESLERSVWPSVRDGLPALRVDRVGIDTGGTSDEDRPDTSRTDEVYRWCNANPMLRVPLKGASKPLDRPVRWRDITYTPPGQKSSAYQVRLHLFDVDHHADLLMGAVRSETQWQLNDQNDPEYNRHLANVHKVMTKYRGKMTERWIPKSLGARHDYWDCEKMQYVLAIGMQLCIALPTAEQLAAYFAQMKDPDPAPKQIGRTGRDGGSFFAHRR